MSNCATTGNGDVFNNPSNDYVDPGLAPCAGTGDDAYFEFIQGGAGITSGADILAFMDLSNIKVPVTTWSIQKKTLQSGEVAYVTGTEKGLMNRTQVFDIVPDGYSDDTSKFFMMLDISISYYNNFRYYNSNVDSSSNYSLNISIENAMNIALDANAVKAGVVYDPSTFSFVGTAAGYDFNVSNAVLTLIDASMNANSPFPAIIVGGVNVPQVYTLIEDSDKDLPATKYPNGAMLGYVLKSMYPTGSCMYDSWIYMNHVESPYEVFIPEIITNYIEDINTYQTLTFDPLITWPSFLDSSFGPTDASITYDTSTFVIDNSIVSWKDVSICSISDSSINDSNIYDSSISGSYIIDSYLTDASLNHLVEDTSIYNSDVSAGILNTVLLDNSEILSSFINADSVVVDSIIENSWTNAFEVVPGLWTNDVSCGREYITGGIIHDSSINNTTVTDSSIYTSQIYDSSLVGCTLYNVELEDSSIVDSTNIYINSTCSLDVSILLDTSIYYKKYDKIINVGMNGCGDDTTLSAGDYLDYVNTHNLWDKVGPFTSRITTPDAPGNPIKNLIGGFYLFNPQTFPVQVEYMTIN